MRFNIINVFVWFAGIIGVPKVTPFTVQPALTIYHHSYVSDARKESSTMMHHDKLIIKNRYLFSNMQLKMVENNEFDSALELTEDEWEIINYLNEKAETDNVSIEELMPQALATMSPSLIIKLRQVTSDDKPELQKVSDALMSVLDSRLSGARDILAEFLAAGEIRKLDALIGKAARDGKLDAAFFQVLNVNLQDAASKEGQQNSSASSPPPPPSQTEGEGEESSTANRYQILKHISTRCQEEVEKTIPPGIALLNKLLRTEVPAIRQNQLKHYLCPQPNVIKAPDGKEIELEGVQKVLVTHDEFVEAIRGAVLQIRTVEKAGGTSREDAAGMVEFCRQVAKEARVVIGENFGADSEELRKFEGGLMPVFRPSSPESPYIQGQ